MNLTQTITSLRALSVGDAFGENQLKILPQQYRSAWPWTDDTAMAIGIVRCLIRNGTINQDDLMREFSENYLKDPHRGYGRGTVTLCNVYVYDKDWALSSRASFNGNGSYGNGAAMRSSPIGLFFDDYATIANEARKSAEVTHWNDEAIAGAIAVAIAARAALDEPQSFWKRVLEFTPNSEVKTELTHASVICHGTVEEVAGRFGCGSKVTALDTVPYALWCAYQGLQTKDFAATLTEACKVGGDTDTYCAMIGGILGNVLSIPKQWIDRTEILPDEWNLV